MAYQIAAITMTLSGFQVFHILSV